MDALLGFLNNPVTLTLLTMAIGVFIKYHPAAKNWNNTAISFLNALLAFLVKLGGPGVAHAGALGALGGFGSGLWHAVSGGILQSAGSYILYKTFLHDLIEKQMGIPVQEGGE